MLDSRVLTITPGAATLLVLRSVLASIHLVMGLIWLSAVCLFVGWMRSLFAHAEIQRKLEALTGIILIGFGLRLAFEQR